MLPHAGAASKVRVYLCSVTISDIITGVDSSLGTEHQPYCIHVRRNSLVCSFICGAFKAAAWVL
jgi:hypothetical protein